MLGRQVQSGSGEIKGQARAAAKIVEDGEDRKDGRRERRDGREGREGVEGFGIELCKWVILQSCRQVFSRVAIYERIKAWEQCHRLCIALYAATKSWPQEERY